MTSDRLKFSCLFACVLLVAACAHAQQQSRSGGRPVIFSDTKRDPGTNVEQVTSRRIALENLENSLKKPFSSLDFSDPGSRLVDAPSMQPPTPQLSGKQLRALMERSREEKEWAFKSPADFQKGYGMTAEEIFKLPEYGSDGQEKKKLSPMERWVDRQDRSRYGSTNGVAGSEPYGTKKEEKEDLFGARREVRPFETPGEEAMRRMLEGRSGADDSMKPKNIGDVFGLNNEFITAAKAQQDLRLEKFKQLLVPGVASGTAGLTPSLGAVTPGFKVPTGLGSTPGAFSTPAGVGTLPASIGSALQPLSLQTALPITPPAVQPPRQDTAAPASTAFSVPKRKF